MNLDQRISALSDEADECRVRRHQMEDIPDDGEALLAFQSSRSVTRLVQRCMRCTTKRYEAWNSITGQILGVRYIYPPGYLLSKGGGGRIPLSDFRVYYLRNFELPA